MQMQPASPIQRQFWLINQLDRASTAYNMPSAMMLEGPLDIAALEAGIAEIVERHEILRTNFISDNGRLMQMTHARRAPGLPVTDAGEVAAPLRREKTMGLIADHIRKPFDLAQDPLLRCLLVRLDHNQHVFSLVMHHIITDLHTKHLFSVELGRLYNARVSGTTPDLAPPRQYAPCAARQLQWLPSPAAQEMVAFWARQLRGQETVLNLPVDASRPPVQTYRGDVVPFTLDPAQVRELRAVCKQWLVDIYVVLLTAFLVLLKRYTHQQKIVIGVPMTNRRHDGDDDVMGCFVNILPLAFNLESVADFRQAVKHVRLRMLEAHRRQEAPLEAILAALKTKRDPSYNPLFQVGFTAEPHMTMTLDNLAVTPIPVHNRGAQLDLFLTLKHLGKEVHGHIEFNTDLFATATIERMRDHYLTLLGAVVGNAALPLSRLPILTPGENEQLLGKWNQTAAPVQACTLAQLIEEKAAQVPDRTAAVFEDRTLTYAALDARANQLAWLLREHGVGPDTLVGVYLERSLEMLVAVYGILKAGGAYVPLDREFPPHRIQLMIEDAQPKVILTQATIADDLPPGSAERICLDRDRDRIDACSSSNPPAVGTPGNLAYVLFTSGSTGRPKGVQVPHRAVVNFLCSMQQTPGIGPAERLLAVTTLSFDISVLELFLPLTVGATVVIAGTQTARDGQALLALLQSAGITMIQATPTTFHLLLRAGWNFPLPVKVLCGGESFPQDLAHQLTRLAASVWNMYGPTETTVWSTCHPITAGQPVLVGRPIANTQIYIVNDAMQPTPIGVPGELLIGGLGVSRGYLHRPELNEQMFVRDIFNPDAQTPLYRTGDLACYLPDGNIKILGRIDHQIKIRGYRIELGEIETAITRHPAVRQAAVKPHAFATDDIRLCAYVTLYQGHTGVPLRDYLKDLLPDYMIPSIVTVLDRMPLTPNNKIDRKTLPAPDRTRPEINREMAPPQTETERHLARTWAALLQLEQVGIDDSFFDLGGTSLLSIQLIAQLEQELNIKIPVVKFYQHPTVRLFAQYLGQNREKPADRTRAAISERVRKQQQAIARMKLQMTGKS